MTDQFGIFFRYGYYPGITPIPEEFKIRHQQGTGEFFSIAYHHGLVRSLELTDVTDVVWKVAGRGCATCRAAGETRPPHLVPPAHPGCECTVSP